MSQFFDVRVTVLSCVGKSPLAEKDCYRTTCARVCKSNTIFTALFINIPFIIIVDCIDVKILCFRHWQKDCYHTTCAKIKQGNLRKYISVLLYL